MEYVPRLIDIELSRRVGSFPAVMLVGPRACGKTTSAARVAASVTRLDRSAVATVFRFDADAALAERAEPALLDEWQEVPEVLAAVKRAVDQQPDPGRFILTGSVDAHRDASSWPGTGRIIQLPMYGMTVGERQGRAREVASLAEVLRGETKVIDPPDLLGYVDLALQSGFPEASRLVDGRDRRDWLDGYVEQMITRDVAKTGAARDPERLRRYLQAWALNSAGTPHDRTLIESAGIDRRTHVNYETTLRNVYAIDIVPAWTSNRLKRLVEAPKRYMVDPALMAAAARFGRADVMADGDLLGRLVDTFVAAEVRVLAGVDPERPRLFHVRTQSGRQEIDLVAEYDGGRVFGIEVKATSAPSAADAKHLRWLAEQMGDRFLGGVVFHTGPAAFEIGPNILALPIAALWAKRGSS